MRAPIALTRTLAVTRYLMADLLRSQRFVLPLLVYVAAVAVLMGGDPGPPPQPWAASVGLLYPISAWLAITVSNAEEPVGRQVTVAASGGWPRLQAGVMITCLVGDMVLLACAVLRPLVPLGGVSYPYSSRMVLVGVLAHVAAAGTGTALGIALGRPLIGRIGWSAVLIGLTVLATITQPWLPPVGAAILTLNGSAPSLSVLTLYAALGLLLSGMAGWLTVIVERRYS